MELVEWFVPAEIVRQRLSLAHFISVDHLTVGQVLPWQQTLVYHIADRLSFHILCCSIPSWELQSVSDSVQCVIPQNWFHSVTQSILHTRPLEADSTCISLLCPTKPVAGNYHTDNNNCFFFAPSYQLVSRKTLHRQQLCNTLPSTYFQWEVVVNHNSSVLKLCLSSFLSFGSLVESLGMRLLHISIWNPLLVMIPPPVVY